MSAKHKRPFYVFAAVAAICAVILVSGFRASRADDGAPFVASPLERQAAALIAPAPTFEPTRSAKEFPGTDEDAPGGDPARMVRVRAGAGGSVPTPPDVDALTPSGARDIQLPLPGGGLGVPDLDAGLDGLDGIPGLPGQSGLSGLEDAVRGAGEIRRGHPDEDKDKEKDKDDSGEGTGGGTSGSNVDPMSEDAGPGGADEGAGTGQGTGLPVPPVLP